MRKEFLEAGKIVGVHGVRGEIRVGPWCDEPSFLIGFQTWFIGGCPLTVRNARVHKRLVLAKLEGFDDVESARALRGKVVSIRRIDAVLPEGRFFIQDLIDLDVVDDATGEPLGTLSDVWPRPGQDIYVVTGQRGERRLVPNAPDFIKSVDLDEGTVRISLIEGM